jgi:hypothetical protein
MTIQPGDGLLAIYELDKSNQPDTPTIDGDLVDLQEVLDRLETHKATLLKVTDVHKEGWGAKTIALNDSDKIITYAYSNVENKLVAVDSEPALEGTVGEPVTLIHLGSPLPFHTPLSEELYLPEVLVRWWSPDTKPGNTQTAPITNAYKDVCTVSGVQGILASGPLREFIYGIIGNDTHVVNLNARSRYIPIPGSSAVALDAVEQADGWRDLLNLVMDVSDISYEDDYSFLLDDFYAAHSNVEGAPYGRLEAEIVAGHLDNVRVSLEALSEKLPQLVSVINEQVKYLEHTHKFNLNDDSVEVEGNEDAEEVSQ